MKAGAFKPRKTAPSNSETFSHFLKLGVCWENSVFLAHRRAEEAFVLTSLAGTHFPPSQLSQSSEYLYRLGISDAWRFCTSWWPAAVLHLPGPEIVPSSGLIPSATSFMSMRFVDNVTAMLWFIRKIYIGHWRWPKYISHLPQFLTHISQNSWNFISVENDKGVFC